jgi:general secretion pathway protein I
MAKSYLPRVASASLAERGFTLIEVLAALIIVSLGMLAVIQAVGQTASNTAYLEEKTVAHWVAMNRLTDVRLQQRPPQIEKTSDEVEMSGRRWRWTMEVQKTGIESMLRIDIRVGLVEDPPDSSLASITGFYGTSIAPPGATLVTWVGQPASGGPGGENPRNPGDGGKRPRNPQPPPGGEPSDPPGEEPAPNDR